MENSRYSFSILDKMVPNTFTHNIIDVDPLFKRLIYHSYVRRLFRYGPFIITTMCGACQFAFHIGAIKYCKENGIKNVYDGANNEHDLSPMHIRQMAGKIDALYTHYSLKHCSPIYDDYPSQRSDEKLYKYGLRVRHEIKDDVVVPWRYQPRCSFAGALGYYKIWQLHKRGYPEKVQKAIVEFYQKELDYYRSLIDEMIEKV